MLEDPLLDVLLAAVAVAMLFLALEVHSLKRFRFPSLGGQALASELPPKEEPKRKLSPTEIYLKQFDEKETTKPEEKPTPEETRTTLAVKPPPALPHGKSEPFRPEALANE